VNATRRDSHEIRVGDVNGAPICKPYEKWLKGLPVKCIPNRIGTHFCFS
jgi:hypothetical protein